MTTACSCRGVAPIARSTARSRLRCTSPSTNTLSTLRPAATITTYPAIVNGFRNRLIPAVGLRAPLLVVVHRQSRTEIQEIVTVGGRIGGAAIVHRDLVADGGPIGARQLLRRQDDIAHRGVIDDPWLKDPGHPVTLRPVDRGQLDGVARGDSEPAGGHLAQADLPFPQTLPQRVVVAGRLIQRLAVPIPRCHADDEARRLSLTRSSTATARTRCARRPPRSPG